MSHYILCYGAKRSGYASSDGIFLLVDEDYPQPKGVSLVSFMNVPVSVQELADLGVPDGSSYGYKFLTSGNESLGFGWIDMSAIGENSGCVITVESESGKQTGLAVMQCDFYDISGGRERLVLKGYNPGEDHYKAGNLMRVFVESMYEYY